MPRDAAPNRPDPALIADVVRTPWGEDGRLYYPHYWSTYCIHLNHADCRLTCKTCDAPCLCPCHEEGRTDG